MNATRGLDARSPEALREEWRSASANTTWLRPDDWYHPAVDALVEALHESHSVATPAFRLGRARGKHGVSVVETIDDIVCLYRAHGQPPSVEALRAVSAGWAEGHESTAMAPHVRDPETGIATAPYLIQRLRETYGVAQRDGHVTSDTHTFLAIDVRVDGLTFWERVARSAAMGRILMNAFGEGHPMAGLGNGTFVVLNERTTNDDALRSEMTAQIEHTALTLGVTSILRRPPGLWTEPLPPTHAGAVALLRDLQR